MRLVKEIFDSTPGSDYLESDYRIRKAARAIVLNKSQKMALLHVSTDGYYKLPGGGIEQGENIQQALQREIREEAGVQIEILSEVGITIEYRNHTNLLQISYCYLTKLVGEASPPSFTQHEQDKGFKLIWVTIEEAISLMKSNNPGRYVGNFIVERDLAFIEEGRNLIKLNSSSVRKT